MWIVRLALRRPYSIAVLAVMITLLGALATRRMRADIFPSVDIPVVVVVWSYPGLTAEDMERRIVLVCERGYSTTVGGISKIESQSMSGIGILKVSFEPGTEIGAAIAQIGTSSEHVRARSARRRSPARRTPSSRRPARCWSRSTVASSAAPSPPPPAPPAPSPAPTIRDVTAPSDDKVGVLAPNTGIPVGEKIPDVHATDLDGKDVSLSSLVAKGPVLLVFYRGGWCPFCNSEIHSLTTVYPEFQKRGVTPVAISVDAPDAEAKLKATYQIPFPVLSDVDAKIIEAFHVVKKVTDEEYARMKGNGVDIEKTSGKTHHEIAIPAFFLLDRGGVVRWAHSDPEFRVRPSTAQLLAAIDAKLGHADGDKRK